LSLDLALFYTFFPLPKISRYLLVPGFLHALRWKWGMVE
jgi:hypothetical protein